MWSKSFIDSYKEVVTDVLRKAAGRGSVAMTRSDANIKYQEFMEYYFANDRRTELFHKKKTASLSIEESKELIDCSAKIVRFESEAMDSPIYKKLVKEHGDPMELPKFLTEGLVGEAIPAGNMAPGWYQNLRGELYHYNGFVWDKNVPYEKDEELEFLGGK